MFLIKGITYKTFFLIKTCSLLLGYLAIFKTRIGRMRTRIGQMQRTWRTRRIWRIRQTQRIWRIA